MERDSTPPGIARARPPFSGKVRRQTAESTPPRSCAALAPGGGSERRAGGRALGAGAPWQATALRPPLRSECFVISVRRCRRRRPVASLPAPGSPSSEAASDTAYLLSAGFEHKVEQS